MHSNNILGFPGILTYGNNAVYIIPVIIDELKNLPHITDFSKCQKVSQYKTFLKNKLIQINLNEKNLTTIQLNNALPPFLCPTFCLDFCAQELKPTLNKLFELSPLDTESVKTIIENKKIKANGILFEKNLTELIEEFIIGVNMAITILQLNLILTHIMPKLENCGNLLFPRKTVFLTFLKAIHKFNLKRKTKTSIRVKSFLGNSKLKFLSNAYMYEYVDMSTRFIFEKQIYNPLSFSLLAANYQFDLLTAMPIKHLTLNANIGKYNTSFHSWILNVPAENLKILWTRNNTFKPFLTLVNYDIFFIVIKRAYSERKMNEILDFLSTQKKDPQFEITKNWKCHSLLHKSVVNNFISLIEASGLGKICPQINHYFFFKYTTGPKTNFWPPETNFWPIH